MGRIYRWGALVVWVVAFLSTWTYCSFKYGFLLGFGIGWLPSSMLATVIAALWPLFAFGAVAFALLLAQDRVRPSKHLPWEGATDLKCSDVSGGQQCAWTDTNGVRRIAARVNNGQHEPTEASAPATDTSPETSLWDLDIAEAADKYKIPAELVRATITAGSNFDPRAVGPSGAQGLMQLTAATAAEMYVGDPFDPVQSIHGGTRYLRVLANQFNGDLVKVVAAYHAGPDAVRAANGIPNRSDTQGYVRKVVRLYRIYRGLDSAAPVKNL